MYSRRPAFVIGFHGCEKEVRDKIVMQETGMKKSENDYDWLGHGCYFWENNYERALQFAIENKKEEPSVLGAFLDLGNCLDLLDSKYLGEVKDSYPLFCESVKAYGLPLPVNSPTGKSNDKLVRKLDCAMINFHCSQLSGAGTGLGYDSVRGVFWEGEDLYPGAGMKEKNHIQICIRNTNCIKGFFIPRKPDEE